MPISRRRFLATGAAVAGGAAVVGGGAFAAGRETGGSRRVRAASGAVPFEGPHQAGIATEQQDRLLFAAFDVQATRRGDLVALLRQWTEAARSMAAGKDAGVAPNRGAPPGDTGEAMGLDPARLTVTFGFGPTIFEQDGKDRFGLAGDRPAALEDLPPFAGDNLDPAKSGGDLCVQACSNDPQVAYHAIRNLTRIARGTATVCWVQQGFGRTSSTTSGQATPRNLLGFKDGTNNLRTDQEGFDAAVWVQDTDAPAWMRGGSYLVARRIRMHIEVWDRSTLDDQELTIGRSKEAGAPLGRQEEFDPIDLGARNGKGLVVPSGAHVRLANQASHGITILRRGYSFTDGIAPDTGHLDAGLFFLAYQRDPRRQFVPLQRALAGDALNEYIQHVGSALFAVPPGVGERGWWGETLLA